MDMKREQADKFNNVMQFENINTVILYGGKPVYTFPQFIHKQTGEKENFPYNYPFRNSVEYTVDMCPNACDLVARTVFLPISPLLYETDIEQISQGVIKVYKGLFE